MLRQIAKTALQFYATRLPYHPGKWRVTEAALAFFGVENLDRGHQFSVERGGVHWTLRTDCAVQRKLFYHGAFDRHDVRELLSRVPSGGVFFDIGSYFGYYAMLAARRGAQVYAFEPFPANYELLARHARLNAFPQVQIFPLALSDTTGRMRFASPGEENRGRGYLLREADGHKELGDEVEITTLDAFVHAHPLDRLDALKLDVEGAECQVLAGGRETITRFRPAMLIELNPPCLERFGSSGDELLQTVRNFGYEIWVSRRNGLERFAGLSAEEGYVNLICLPRQ